MRLLRRRPPRVERYRRKGDTERLVKLLRHEDLARDRDGRVVDRAAGERTRAVEALIDIGGPGAHAGLRLALRDPEPVVRSAAIRGLRARGYAEAAAPLVEAVTSWTEERAAANRGEALEALVSFGRPELARAVVDRLLARRADIDDGDRPVIQALVEAGGPDAARTAVGDLVARLRDGRAAARARTLLTYLAPESVDPLIDLLDDDDTRREAAWALGAIHDSRATEPLCHVLLSSDDPGVRVAASWALGEIRDPAAVAALLRASNDSDFDVRAETIAAFDKLGNVAVAIAMSVQVRAALEEGAERASSMLDGGGDVTSAALGEAHEEGVDDEAADGEATAPGGPAASRPRPAQPSPYPPRTPLADRARPILRRWLGEPPRP